LDKGKGATADFAKVGKGRPPAIPKFVRGFAAQGRCRGEVSEVGCSNAELVPKGGRSIASQSHSPRFSEDRPMNTFGATILS